MCVVSKVRLRSMHGYKLFKKSGVFKQIGYVKDQKHNRFKLSRYIYFVKLFLKATQKQT